MEPPEFGYKDDDNFDGCPKCTLTLLIIIVIIYSICTVI